MSKQIPLSKGAFALVDDADFDRLMPTNGFCPGPATQWASYPAAAVRAGDVNFHWNELLWPPVVTIDKVFPHTAPGSLRLNPGGDDFSRRHGELSLHFNGALS
jgi:hypothetical protein